MFICLILMSPLLWSFVFHSIALKPNVSQNWCTDLLYKLCLTWNLDIINTPNSQKLYTPYVCLTWLQAVIQIRMIWLHKKLPVWVEAYQTHPARFSSTDQGPGLRNTTPGWRQTARAQESKSSADQSVRHRHLFQPICAAVRGTAIARQGV